MDIEEVKKLAINGDVKACMELGSYYYNQDKSARGMQEALKWYLIAADKKDFGAMRMVILTNGVFAHAQMQVCADIAAQYDSAALKYSDIADLADELYKLTDGNPAFAEIHQFAYNEWISALYRFGVCAYFNGNNETIMDLFEEFDEPQIQVLKGVTMSIKSAQDLKQAYAWLKPIETKEYFKLIGTKLEEQLAAMGALRISVYYRMLLKNLDGAVNFLNNMLPSFSSDLCKGIINDELSMYKKKTFGGYKYEG